MRVAWTTFMLGSCALLTGGVTSRSHAQSPATPCPAVKNANNQAVPDPKCVPAASPSPVGRFPYPGEGASDATAPGAPISAGGTAAPAGETKSQPTSGSAGKRFPYPGEGGSGEAKAAPDQRNGLSDAGSSGEASSPPGSSSSSSSSNPEQTPAGSSSSSSSSANDPDSGSPFTDPDTAPAPKKGRRKLPPVARQTPSEREEEDVRVAGFYMNDGNFKAAYSRAQDAVSLSSDDPDAHLALAEAARKLGKLDEAQQHYKRCMELDPVPKQRRIAERALKEMSGGA